MPDRELHVAEAIKLACVLYQFEQEGTIALQNGTIHWYDTYVSYAVSHGILSETYRTYSPAQMNAPISRGEFVFILHHALQNYPIRNDIANHAIADVSIGDPFAAEIYDFYRAGILNGCDSRGTFYPNASIKRSEIAAILLRTCDETTRLTFSLSGTSI